MSRRHREFSEFQAPVPTSGGLGWFLGWFLVGLGISAVLIVLIVHLCNVKVARDQAKKDLEWRAAHPVASADG